MKRFLILVFYSFNVLILSRDAFSQSLFSVTGKVIEEDKKSIYGAQVFLNGTSKSVVSDKEGNFQLNGLSPGTYELVVSLLGYKTYSKQIRIENEDVRLTAILAFNAVSLKEVVVRPDIHREENLEVFKANFLGQSANAKQCKLVNPEVLNITFDHKERLLEADSGSEFLLIENRALGYKVRYLLMDFRLDFKSGQLSYFGKTVFEELSGPRARAKKWLMNRGKAYLGSAQHFLTSLFHNTVYQDGYQVQKLIRKANTERPSDSVISANIRRLSNLPNGTLQLSGNDSIQYWVQKRKIPKIHQYIIKGNIYTDSLLTDLSGTMKQFAFHDYLYVTYTREREPPEYNSWNGTFPKPLDQPNYQVSIVTMNDAISEIDKQGNLADPMSLLFEGYWAFEKVGDLLPSDYRPL